MSDYAAPLADMRFVLDEIAGLGGLAELPGLEQAAPDIVDAVLDEAGRLAGNVLAPLNRVGDLSGSVLENGVVRTPAGFKEAYARYVEGGWNALQFPERIGGQGLPQAVAAAVSEMWASANMSFALGPLLTVAAVEALEAHGSAELKRLYLDKLVSGEWAGAMNLTEPQAGSDVGALRTRAMRDGDHYRLTGQKIFITYGEHDWTPNIVHLVLARLPDAPPGSAGISLFLVPKFLVESDGEIGARNDVRCVSLEHKLGIHASPTCVLAFGDNGGAEAWLVGEEHKGLACMFTMMNRARLDVGLQGLAIAERAWQQARAYARLRVQSRPIGTSTGAGETPPIIHHPDVRRMLLSMRASIEAMRSLAYYTAGELDRARHLPDAEERALHQRRGDLLIPVVKAWSSDLGFETASTNIQIHGGTGYIEETGAAQLLRDARIAMIYEGTNGIQANDLVGRKLVRDRGAALRELLAEMRRTTTELAEMPGETPTVIRRRLADSIDVLERTSAALVTHYDKDPAKALAGAVPYLKLMGIVCGGWLLAKGVAAALRLLEEKAGDARFLHAKLATARFYTEHVLALAPALVPAITGGATVMEFDLELL